MPASLTGATAQTPAAAAAASPAAPTTQDSGSWAIVPGVLSVNWSFDPTAQTADIKAVLFGLFTIDELTGQLSSTSAELNDTINLLDVVEGGLAITADYTAKTITVSGTLSLFGANSWHFSFPLVTW